MKSDVVIAKNYLSQEEMISMEYIVSAYLDLAENRARRRIAMTMGDWAKEHAETEFEKYRAVQDRLFMSDFDKFMLELEEKAKAK